MPWTAFAGIRIAGKSAKRWRQRSARAIVAAASGPTDPSRCFLRGLSPMRVPRLVRSSAPIDGVIGGNTSVRQRGQR
ncbi:hypothetical protein [Amycolatopsis japonica]